MMKIPTMNMKADNQPHAALRALLLVVVVLVMTGCYNRRTPSRFMLPDSLRTPDSTAQARLDSLSKEQQDSASFAARHHYGIGFNFIVRGDSLNLTRQEPEEVVSQMPVDSFAVAKGIRLAVTDIRTLPADSIDSVWVQVVTEQYNIGWAHENELLARVDPDDPISQFISTFSNIHLIIFLVVISLIAVGYIGRKLLRRNSRIVHFNDINSFYPTLLALIVASSATFYATIQNFAPETWREFYFHPTLNPFSQPWQIEIFLTSVWAMLIVGIAAVDDTRHQLKLDDAFWYLCGLAAVCAVDYIVFSISTLYYIGYPLLVAYFWYALRVYFRRNRNVYICGNCGAKLHRKGRCPHCGTMNE